MTATDSPATRLATRLAFFVAGFGVSAWAPLIPLTKHRLGVSDGTLGLLLLCIGIGSVLAMVATGPLAARFGSRPVITGGGVGLALLLPTLPWPHSPAILALLLGCFGAALGSLDVAMNVHAVAVERASGRKLMSGFHALFSIGGFAGAGAVTVLLSSGLSDRAATLICAAAMLAAIGAAAPRLIAARPDHDAPLVVVPHGVVLLLALLAAITFLVEGAVLDWSALLVANLHRIDPSRAGIGYVLFSTAMTIGRLAGDRVTARLGDTATTVTGGLVAVAGLLVVLLVPFAAVALGGFILVGLGASNLVPILFRRAGTQTAMPPALAVAAITTTGYAGVLAGPAVIGFVSGAIGLPAAFWGLAALLCLVPLTARRVGGRPAPALRPATGRG